MSFPVKRLVVDDFPHFEEVIQVTPVGAFGD
jgi:hypothetical protein